MSRKTSNPSSSSGSPVTSKSTAKSKTKGFEPVPKPTKSAAVSKLIGKPAAAPAPAAKPASAEPATKSAAASTPAPAAPPKSSGTSPKSNEADNQVLTRAEHDIAAAIESLNNQMNAALTALAGLASAQQDRGKAVVRTAPLDRATATFQRLVAEVVDDQLAEMLPPLIALRNETNQWASTAEADSAEADFHRRGLETLDHVLTLAGATSFDARPGQAFDALIHLAVGECRREDLVDGAVAECLQVGFRTSRGKVLSPARVRINRR